MKLISGWKGRRSAERKSLLSDRPKSFLRERPTSPISIEGVPTPSAKRQISNGINMKKNSPGVGYHTFGDDDLDSLSTSTASGGKDDQLFWMNFIDGEHNGEGSFHSDDDSELLVTPVSQSSGDNSINDFSEPSIVCHKQGVERDMKVQLDKLDVNVEQEEQRDDEGAQRSFGGDVTQYFSNMLRTAAVTSTGNTPSRVAITTPGGSSRKSFAAPTRNTPRKEDSDMTPARKNLRSNLDEIKFQPYYRAWCKAGLMKWDQENSFLAANGGQPSPSPFKRPVELPPGSPKVSELTSKFANRLSIESSRSCESSSKLPPSSTQPFLSARKVEKPSTAAQNNPNFGDLLKRWKVQSDDKPNTHFLSPDNERKRLKKTSKIVRNVQYSRQSIGAVNEGRSFAESLTDASSTDPEHLADPSTSFVDTISNTQSSASDFTDTSIRDILSQLGNFSSMESRVPRRHDDLANYDEPCDCTGSVFSGNDELIAFFLPQMGMACTCGKQSRKLVNIHEPTAIENILRPWQCDFLQSFRILRGDQLVKARHRSGTLLAKALRHWRNNENMLPFKTSSCKIAIDIWARTCKSYVRSVRRQLAAGNRLEQQTGIVLTELSEFMNELPFSSASALEEEVQESETRAEI